MTRTRAAQKLVGSPSVSDARLGFTRKFYGSRLSLAFFSPNTLNVRQKSFIKTAGEKPFKGKIKIKRLVYPFKNKPMCQFILIT